jgi:outer membrane lipoprotein-sorting protein
MRRDWLKATILLLPLLNGCGVLYHTRRLNIPEAPAVTMNATVDQLADSLQEQYDSIHSLTATVEFQASVNNTHKGEVKDYTHLPGYILMRKPEMLRVIGMLPVFHTPAFDLASDGRTFKLLIKQPRTKAIEGNNSVTNKSPNTLENLRPQVFFDSLLIKGVDADEMVLLSTDNNTVPDPKNKQLVMQMEYLLTIVKRKPDSRELKAERVIRFDRANLQPVEEDTIDKDGNVETQALYGPYQTFGPVKFPGTVTIKRPLDNYQIVLTIEKLQLNQALQDNQFDLKIPEGIPLQKLN